jgi:hypothetical protein
MDFADLAQQGWNLYPSESTGTGYFNPGASQFQTAATPPDSVLQAMGIQWDPSKYAWDPVNGVLTDRSDGGSWNFGNGGADPSLGTNVVTPQGTQNFAQGTTPVFSDVGNSSPFGLPTADAYKWYADQKNGNQNNFLGAAAGLIGGPLLAGALSGAAAGTGAVGDTAASGYGISPGFLGGGGADALIPGGGVLAPAATNTLAGSALAGAGLPTSAAGLVDAATLAPGAGVLAPGALSGLGGLAGNAATGGGAGSGSASNAGPQLQDPNSVTDSILKDASGMATGIDWAKLLPSLIGGGLGLVDSLTQPNSTTKTAGGTSASQETSEHYCLASSQALLARLSIEPISYWLKVRSSRPCLTASTRRRAISRHSAQITHR